MDAWMDGWMDEWRNGWMDGWMDEWMDELMDEWMDQYNCIVYQCSQPIDVLIQEAKFLNIYFHVLSNFYDELSKMNL